MLNLISIFFKNRWLFLIQFSNASVILFISSFFFQISNLKNLVPSFLKSSENQIYFLSILGNLWIISSVLTLISLISYGTKRATTENNNFINLRYIWYLIHYGFGAILLLTPTLLGQSPRKLFQIFLFDSHITLGLADLLLSTFLILLEFLLRLLALFPAD
jgi:hypothetical protein